MNQVKSKPLPKNELRKIQDDLQKNFKVPRLLPDGGNLHLPNQNFALVSVISPLSQTQNIEWKDVEDLLIKKRFSKIARMQLLKMIHEKTKFLIKFRGAFANLGDAETFARERIGMAEGIETHVVPLYEYGFYPPSKYADKNKMNLQFADAEAQKFYKTQKMKKEEDARVFQRRMELFRQETKENNEAYAKLTDEEKADLCAKDAKQAGLIEGVPIEKILENEKIKKVMTRDTFDTIRKISDHLDIGYEQMYEAWAKMLHADKTEREVRERDALEKAGSSTSSSVPLGGLGLPSGDYMNITTNPAVVEEEEEK